MTSGSLTICEAGSPLIDLVLAEPSLCASMLEAGDVDLAAAAGDAVGITARSGPAGGLQHLGIGVHRIVSALMPQLPSNTGLRRATKAS